MNFRWLLLRRTLKNLEFQGNMTISKIGSSHFHSPFENPLTFTLLVFRLDCLSYPCIHARKASFASSLVEFESQVLQPQLPHLVLQSVIFRVIYLIHLLETTILPSLRNKTNRDWNKSKTNFRQYKPYSMLCIHLKLGKQQKVSIFYMFCVKKVVQEIQ